MFERYLLFSCWLTLIRRFGGVPSLGLQGLGKKAETLLIDAEIGVSDTRGAAHLHGAIFDLQLEIVHEGLATVQEFGKVANTALVLNVGLTRARQVFGHDRPASLIDVVLSFL